MTETTTRTTAANAPEWLLNTPHVSYTLAAADPCRSAQPDQQIELTFAEYEAVKSFLHIYRACPNTPSSKGLPAETHIDSIKAQAAWLKDENTDEQQEAFHLDIVRRYVRMCPDLVLSIQMPEPWASIMAEFEASRKNN